MVLVNILLMSPKFKTVMLCKADEFWKILHDVMISRHNVFVTSFSLSCFFFLSNNFHVLQTSTTNKMKMKLQNKILAHNYYWTGIPEKRDPGPSEDPGPKTLWGPRILWGPMTLRGPYEDPGPYNDPGPYGDPGLCEDPGP